VSNPSPLVNLINMTRTLLGWLICAVFLIGCSDPPQPTGKIKNPGTGFTGAIVFDYETHKSTAEPLTRGNLLVPWPLEEGSSYTGTWEAKYSGAIKKDATPSEIDAALRAIGPQVGRGTLSAYRKGDQVFFQLNPNMIDNNVSLVGTVKDTDLAGEWSWSSIAGVSAKGGFTAHRQQP
jgi:hypothetical protein